MNDKNDASNIPAVAGAVAGQALTLNASDPNKALVSLLVAGCWISKSCAPPGITDQQIIDKVIDTLKILAPGAFADLETWKRQQEEAAASKGPTDV